MTTRGEAMRWALRTSTCNPQDRVTLIYLARVVDEDGFADVSINTLSAMSGLTTSTTHRHLTRLVKDGVIEKDYGHGFTNRYRLMVQS